MGGGHAIAFAVHFYVLKHRMSLPAHTDLSKQAGKVIRVGGELGEIIRGGLFSLISLFSAKFNTSQPNWPRPMSTISASRDDHIRVA